MKPSPVYHFILLILIPGIILSQDFNPGKERWPVKTSVLRFHPVKEISLKELLNLPPPVPFYSGQQREEHQDQRFPEPVGMHNLKEGDIVTTTGYILLAAVEKDNKGTDGDYHVQIRLTSQWKDSCFIVEATYPPFIKGNDALQDSCQRVREFFDHFVLKGKRKSCFGNEGEMPIFVRITGQLFFDAFHMNTQPRGKQNCVTKEKMKSYTCWEIHPIMAISFIRKK